MAVGSGALNLESVGGGDEGLAFEDPTEGVELGGGPSRKIGEGALDDPTIESGGVAEEDGGRGVAIGDGFHVHGLRISYIAVYNKHNMAYYMGT
jgi:hypothetical protein